MSISTSTSEPWHGLPTGITSRTIPVRDLDMHILEAGDPSAPLLLLLHGFPELSYSWRSLLLPLARLGYHTVAPDQRGYGRTRPRGPTAFRPVHFDDDLRPFRMLNIVHDALALVSALRHSSVACVIGHDFGSPVAGYCALVRPDVFRAAIFMSAPFTGPPPPTVDAPLPSPSPSPSLPPPSSVSAASRLGGVPAGLAPILAQLDPPRKHYVLYFSTPHANADMLSAPGGLSTFLRAYFHVKSADWAANAPRPLPASAEGLARLPHYYVMPLAASMVDVVRALVAEEEAEHEHAVEQGQAGTAGGAKEPPRAGGWLPDAALAVYAGEFGRTGFQGGLNWYRAMTDGALAEELGLFSGRRVDVPAMFLSGRQDWGVYQLPGALERMQSEVCARMEEADVVLVDGAGHWVQQEKPEEVLAHITKFLQKLPGA